MVTPLVSLVVNKGDDNIMEEPASVVVPEILQSAPLLFNNKYLSKFF